MAVLERMRQLDRDLFDHRSLFRRRLERVLTTCVAVCTGAGVGFAAAFPIGLLAYDSGDARSLDLLFWGPATGVLLALVALVIWRQRRRGRRAP
jgi:hypothetical protein